MFSVRCCPQGQLQAGIALAALTQSLSHSTSQQYESAEQMLIAHAPQLLTSFTPVMHSL